MNKDYEKIKDFMGKSIFYERGCFLKQTVMRNPNEFRIPDNDEFFIYSDNGNIKKDGADYLLDKFSPDGDRENLSYDQGYFEGYKYAMNNLLHFLNTKIK